MWVSALANTDIWIVINRDLVVAVVAPLELDVTQAKNGLEALDHLATAEFDLVLMVSHWTSTRSSSCYAGGCQASGLLSRTWGPKVAVRAGAKTGRPRHYPSEARWSLTTGYLLRIALSRQKADGEAYRR